MASKKVEKANIEKEIKVENAKTKEASTKKSEKDSDKENIDSEEEMDIKTESSETVSEEPIKNEKSDDITQESKPEVEKTPEEEIAEWKNKYLRLSADFDNYRKRTLKEKMDLIKSAGADTIKNIIPIFDDFERAITASKGAKDVTAIKTGNDLIYNKFKDFLKQNGIKEIDAIDKEFDTDLHEAITKIPAPKKKQKGKVIDVIEKGYYLNDKVIRFAKVVIGD